MLNWTVMYKKQSIRWMKIWRILIDAEEVEVTDRHEIVEEGEV